MVGPDPNRNAFKSPVSSWLWLYRAETIQLASQEGIMSPLY